MRASDVLLTSTINTPLSKGKRGIEAVISVKKSASVALLAPPGSGKTEVIHRILNLMPNDKDKTIFLNKPWTNHAKKHIGIALQAGAFIESNRVKDALLRRCRLCQHPISSAETALEEYGLIKSAQSTIATLSPSMKQRLNLARAMLGSPTLLVLDEPFAQLDRVWQQKTKMRFSQYTEKGTAILWSTQNPKHAKESADFIYLLDNGKVLDSGTTQKVFTDKIQIKLKTRTAQKTVALLEPNPAISQIQIVDDQTIALSLINKDEQWLTEHLLALKINDFSCSLSQSILNRLFPRINNDTHT